MGGAHTRRERRMATAQAELGDSCSGARGVRVTTKHVAHDFLYKRLKTRQLTLSLKNIFFRGEKEGGRREVMRSLGREFSSSEKTRLDDLSQNNRKLHGWLTRRQAGGAGDGWRRGGGCVTIRD